MDSSVHSHALTAALAAARRGLPVFPLSRAKQPAVRSPHHADWPRVPCRGECGRIGHGVYDATTDADAVHTLFAAAPWATGYGIACGRPPHHLIGLDLDVKSGTDTLGVFESLLATHGIVLPPTVVVRTPSGGRHIWLTGRPGHTVPNSAGRLAPGVDIRGTGGYLAGPGSRTLHGTYRLAPRATRAPAPAPGALLRLLTPPPPHPPPPPGHPHPERRADALIRFVAASRPGERNARLFWAACRAYETGQGPDLATALVHAAIGTGLPEREAAATVASAARHTPP
ncbi:bifunctional DNA primase/polymerase [Streptomyces sp. MAR4 CNX-425]|uniref:bifunctional DNA primase/polymerase n=1 Tax=Streptomyces sp. MAR4 CNX-425 TaxID=3406343 RepID=UPI003B50ADD2